MKNALALTLAVMLLATGVMGCASLPPVSMGAATPAQGDSHRTPDPALDVAINDFGFDLLGRRIDSSGGGGPRENVILSPLSIHTVLTMTLNGARGETAEEMVSVLHLGSLGLERANPAYADLLAALGELDSSTETTLTVANALWPDVEFELLSAFAETNRRFFGAQLEQIDLGAPEAADRMNSWVAEQTAGDITKLIDKVPPDAVLYLINAVRVEVAWAEPFNASLTRDGEFSNGRKKFTVPFLNRTDTFRYSETDLGQAIRLPTTDGRLGVWVLAPSRADDNGRHLGFIDDGALLDNTIASIDVAAWRDITEAAEERNVSLSLPRFDLRYRVKLKEDLEAMGMPTAFSDAADLYGIGMHASGLPLLIGDVVHETRFVLDEAGARASAATVVGVDVASAPVEPVTMTVDRPFLVAIEDEPTGTLLFLGAIYDPR